MIRLEEMQQKWEWNNLGFTFQKLMDMIGEDYLPVILSKSKYKALCGAKGTMKTFNFCAILLWKMCNFPYWNSIVMRNTLSNLKKTTIKTMIKVINFLMNKHGLTDLAMIKRAVKDPSDSRLEMMDLRKISFISYENLDNASGLDTEVGNFGDIFWDEPIEKSTAKERHIMEKVPKDDFDMIEDSALRGEELVDIIGDYKVEYNNNTYVFPLRRNVFFSMNPWSRKMWIYRDYINKLIPFNQKFKDWTLEDAIKNVMLYEDRPDFEEGWFIARLTKGINPHIDTQERARDKQKLLNLNPYNATATLGWEYDGADPDIFIWRNYMNKDSTYAKKYLAKNYNNASKKTAPKTKPKKKATGIHRRL